MGVNYTACSCVPGGKKKLCLESLSTNLLFLLKVQNICSSSNQNFFCPFWSNILHFCAEETDHPACSLLQVHFIFIVFQKEKSFCECCPVLGNNWAVCVDVLGKQILLSPHYFKTSLLTENAIKTNSPCSDGCIFSN